MDITRWSTLKSDLLYFLQPRWRSSIQSAKRRPGADGGSDHELLIAKFRLKLKKVGKTTRPFRYDLNQIPDDYTVKMRNIFKGLDLIDRVPDEYSGLISFMIGWLDLLAVQGTLKSFLQHNNFKASILLCSVFFMVQLSHLFMTSGKNIALAILMFVVKVISLFFNRLVIAFFQGATVF